MTDPRRLLDGSEASPALRALLGVRAVRELREVFSGQGERGLCVVADERGSGGDDELGLGLAVARAAWLAR